MGTEGWFHHSFCPPIYFQCKITMQNVHVTYFSMYAANAGVAMKDPNRDGDDAGGDGEEESDDG